MMHPPFPFGPALLFCPADRPDSFAKALERADAVILDLEDFEVIALCETARGVLAAGAHGVAAIDTVHLEIADAAGLRAEAEDAAALGFAATACIHPSQVSVVREAYRPDAERLEWARAVLEAAASEPGVFAFRGEMVDAPVLRQAEALVRRAGRA